jgi:hypothetical protein
MRLAIICHDTLAATVIHRHEGTLVKSRGEGDSLVAVFSRASDAVAAARASLGEETFAAAWAEGRAMTLEQAAADALEPGVRTE